jgi:tRNA (cmo5U34)-methyltransferase
MSELSAASPKASPGVESPTGFDRVAWCYDALAQVVFGRSLQKAQLAALEGLPPGAPQVLILGGGTGWVLTEVLRRRPQAAVLYLEASPKMLARAQARLAAECPKALHQVAFRHGTQTALEPAERFDAVITFFVLDCIEQAEMARGLATLRAALRPGAPWLLADFRPAQRGWRWLLLVLMYRFFRLATGLRADALPDLRQALAQLGLVPKSSSAFFAGAVEAVVFSES